MNTLATLLSIITLYGCGPTVPKEVRAHMRPNGVTLEFSILQPNPNGPEYTMHLYAIPKARRGRQVTLEEVTQEVGIPLRLDIYLFRNGRHERISSTPFTGDGGLWPTGRTMWLRPREQKGSIIEFQAGACDCVTNILVIYPNGFDGKAVVDNRFGSGFDDTESTEAFTEKVDSRGNLLILQNHSIGRRQTTSTYRWLRGKFRLVKTFRRKV